MGKSTISMAIFNPMLVYQRVIMENGWKWPIYRWFTYLDCPIITRGPHEAIVPSKSPLAALAVSDVECWWIGVVGSLGGTDDVQYDTSHCQPWSTNRIDHCHDHRLAVTFRLLPPSSPGNGVSFKCSRADDNENGWEPVCSLLALEAKAKIGRHEVPAIQESRIGVTRPASERKAVPVTIFVS